jgi:predicted transposase/invertase (TIGR01784 family)
MVTFSKETGAKMLTIADSLREEGKIEGKIERNAEIAQLMLAEAQPWENIMKFTGLTMAEIEALAKQKG